MQEFLLKLNYADETKGESHLDFNLSDHFFNPKDLRSSSKEKSLFSYSYVTNDLDEGESDFENTEYLVISSLSDEALKSFKSAKSELYAIENQSELVLKFYLTCEKNLFKKITGGFCFVIFQKQTKKIFCIRDQYGLKNLFYSINENTIYFSTRLSFLVSEKNIQKTINLETLADFLELSKNCKTSTFFNEINKLPNACFLVINNFSYEISNFDHFEARINNFNFEESSKNLRILLDKLFERKLDHNKKVGVMFSGGLDSSTILAMISNKKKHSDILAISSVFQDQNSFIKKSADESDFQKELLFDKKVNHQTFEGNNHSTLSDIDTYLKIIGEPFFFPNAYIPFNSFKIARQNDINIVFNGNDGDTVISHGYEILVELFLSFKWIALYKKLSQISIKTKVNKNFIFRRIVIGRFFKQINLFIFFWVRKIFKSNKNLLINNYFSKESKFFERNRPNFPLVGAAKNHLKVLNQNLQFEAIEKQGAMASFSGVDEIYPFYDVELIKYCLSVNPKFKLRNGMQRFILRDSMNDLLPEKILKRNDKSHLSYVLQNDFLKKNKSFISKNIGNPNDFLLKRINYENLLTAWEKIKTKENLINSNELSMIFSFVVVNHWLNSINCN